MVVSPDGSTLIVADEGTGIEQWDLATGALLHTGQAGSTAFGLAQSPDGIWIYAAEWAAGRIAVIDAWTLTGVQTISVGGSPRSLAVSADGTSIVANNEDGRVHLIQ